uniref:Uncharacterized protein n=1 Tax=Anguilla anguilla TaxID=7936 RepID=A0A0E9W2D4_ANGAN
MTAVPFCGDSTISIIELLQIFLYVRSWSL